MIAEDCQDPGCPRTAICPDAPPSRFLTADMAHYIIVTTGSERGKKIEIGLAPIRLGRAADNELVLADPFVSSHHCSIYFEEGQLWVADLASTNGSFIGGGRVEGRAAWPISASLQLGGQVLRHEYLRRAEIQDADDLTRDLRQAASYVQRLLPPPLSSGTVTTAWQYQPSAQLGGDIFDYFWLDSERFVFYLLDVSGHGVGAALHSVAVFSLLRQRALPGVDLARPAQVLQALNDAFPMDRYGSMYFTLWYGVYHLGRRCLGFASAGHPPALMLLAKEGRLLDLASDNPPLGMVSGLRFEEAKITQGSAFRIYLYSDGAYEFTLHNGELWDRPEFVRWLSEGLGNGGGRPGEVFRELSAKSKSGRFEDDFSLLMLDFS